MDKFKIYSITYFEKFKETSIIYFQSETYFYTFTKTIAFSNHRKKTV